jgi:hypothetical protein
MDARARDAGAGSRDGEGATVRAKGEGDAATRTAASGQRRRRAGARQAASGAWTCLAWPSERRPRTARRGVGGWPRVQRSRSQARCSRGHAGSGQRHPGSRAAARAKKERDRHRGARQTPAQLPHPELRAGAGAALVLPCRRSTPHASRSAAAIAPRAGARLQGARRAAALPPSRMLRLPGSIRPGALGPAHRLRGRLLAASCAASVAAVAPWQRAGRFLIRRRRRRGCRADGFAGAAQDRAAAHAAARAEQRRAGREGSCSGGHGCGRQAAERIARAEAGPRERGSATDAILPLHLPTASSLEHESAAQEHTDSACGAGTPSSLVLCAQGQNLKLRLQERVPEAPKCRSQALGRSTAASPSLPAIGRCGCAAIPLSLSLACSCPSMPSCVRGPTAPRHSSHA